MEYFEAINKAYELTVVTDDLTGISYLQPSYRMLLKDNDIHLPGYEAIVNNNDPELWEIVKLEVDKRNAMLNFVNPVAEWIYGAIANTVDPVMTEQENELLKNVIEYLQANEKKKKRGRKKKENVVENTDDNEQ